MQIFISLGYKLYITRDKKEKLFKVAAILWIKITFVWISMGFYMNILIPYTKVDIPILMFAVDIV